MTKNEIKKALYREKPMAHVARVSDNGKLRVYTAELSNGMVIGFNVPFSDMGEREFDLHVPAQLLIRWLV